ncbi:anaerobic ribonucleoside-triphosphate reductase [Desulfobacterales bacterium HSG2]|nr:anaerobic ribonucleoside-triphosphate reductase [Desulfobacterales bacterium HSG2]
MIESIKKRDGSVVKFDSSKITTAISMAGKATGEFGEREAKRLMLQVLTLAHEVCGPIPEVEEIQDIVERILLDSPFHKTAKAYILYREQHTQLRNIATQANVDLVDQYLRKLDWKIKENSNMCYSLQGLNNYISSDVTSEYWLNRIYPPEIREAHKNGDIHIHDLSQLSVYTYFGKEVILAKYRGDLLTLSFEQLYETVEAKEELLNETDNARAKYPDDLFVMDKDQWARVPRLVRKAKDKPMRFLKNGGRSVIVTEDHPMITERGQTEARNVQEKEDKLFTVDMVSRLSDEPLFSEERIDLVHELRSRGFNGRDEDIPYFNGFPVSECSDESDGIVHTLSFCAPRYIRLTEEFGFFVGLILADGYFAYDNKSFFTIASRGKDNLERANTGLLQHGWSGAIIYRGHISMHELRIRNQFLSFLFDKVFQIRPGSRNKTLPVSILSYSSEFLRGIIAGIIDGDSVSVGKTEIQLRMASRTLLEQISVVLPFIGLFPWDRDCEGVGNIREYGGRSITQKFPLYGLRFRKIDSIALPSEKYGAIEPSRQAWEDETVDAWHEVLSNAETNILDGHIYDITTETHTLVVNGMWNHNCVGWDLKDLLLQGFRGVEGKVESAPPRQLRTALGQLVNFIYTLQGECYSDDTEVLTDNGWQLFKDLDKENDKVYTLHPETKEIEIQKPVNFFEFENREMIHFKNSETDLLVTENHSMLVSEHRPDETRKCAFVKAKDYNHNTHLIPKGGEWNGEYREYFELPSVEPEVCENFNPQKWVKKTIPSKKIKMDAWLRFLGWYLSEGSCYESQRLDKRRNQPRKEYVVRIHQKKHCQELENVLDESGFDYTRTEAKNGTKTYCIYNKQLYMYLSQFGKSEDRFVPKEFKNLSVEQLSVLYDALYLGDGLSDTSDGNEEYHTSSKKLADDVQEIILKLGFNADIRRKSNGLGSGYVVGVSKTLHFKIGKESVNRTNYKGKVYCVEVPNHTLYVRRNDKAIWCGNSAGAQAVSNFDTLLAPFVRRDKLGYGEVRQAMQEFVFNANIPTRVGFQCMSEDTEILTSEGWMGHEDVEVGQPIKTFNVKTGEIETLPVKKVFSRHYEGEMYNLTNGIQDQLISSGHRVVRKISNTDDSFVLEEIEKILEYKSPVILPITGKNCNPRKDISDEEIRLLAWIIAEGTKENSTKHRHSHRITIYQSRTVNPENYEEITALLDKRGCEYRVRNSTPAFGGSSCMIRLNAASSQKILDDLFETRDTIKFIPDILKEMDREQARLFLDTYLRADGFEGCKIATADIDILNGLQQVAVDAEYGFTVLEREPTIGKKMLYVLRLIDHQGTSIMEIKKVDYSGIIWCPNTDNETVVARRNGKVFVTGNTPFFNVTMDLEVPSTFKDHPVIIGGEYRNETYADFQPEMDMINQAFAEIMMEGDAMGRVFTFPIPTYNITTDFDWDNPNLDKIWHMTGKFGTPYFSNFVNSDMSPDDVRSMCCRLRLSNKELMKRGGGLFGANPLTGCYDEETEILTEEGWKHFRDLSEGDLVFTLSEGNMIELHKPKRLFQYDYEGMMCNFNARSLDLCVTPNHRMMVDKINNKRRRAFVEARDFDVNNHRIPKQGTWLGEEAEWFVLPEINGAQGNTPCEVVREPLKISMDDWLRFFGFWLAEGSFDNEDIAPSHGYRVFVTQKKEDIREETEAVLDRLPFRYVRESDNYIICDKQLWSYLRQFGKCHEKHIPKEIKKLSERQLNILFEWMVKGDGHVRETGQTNYRTSSQVLAGDVQEIILKIGKLGSHTTTKGKVGSVKGREIATARTCYNVGVQISKHYRLREHNISQSRYAGKVYCCEVDNNTVFVRRNGKVSWCGNSIGVVTINLPRIAHLSKEEKDFLDRLREMVIVAKESLTIKRKILESFTEKNLYPYSKFYLRDVKNGTGLYWRNHFSTIGIIGMNEACLNFMSKDIGTGEAREFSLRVMDFIRDMIVEIQEETDDLFNLEATPAEGTSYRLAMLDKKRFPDIICANECCDIEEPYYTNSTQLPVNYTDDVFEMLTLQDDLQSKYTGGTVLHIYMGEMVSDIEVVKGLIRKITANFRLPYFTLTPTFSICPSHGYLNGEQEKCPACGAETEIYSRIVGYLRPLKQWNKGKQAEFDKRKTFKVDFPN